MSVPHLFARIVRGVARRPLVVIAVAALLALGSGLLALRLEPSAATDTLVGRGSQTFKDTERYHRRFGDDAVIILVKGDLTRIMLTSNLGQLLKLEGCLGGNVPSGAVPLGGARGPCGQLARTKPVDVVYGPGTFVNEAVTEINDQLARETEAATARAKRVRKATLEIAKSKNLPPAEQKRLADAAEQLVQTDFAKTLLSLALRYGVRPPVAIYNANFVSSIVFDPSRGATVPKARFAYLFPNEHSALIQVRLKPTLSDAQRRQAIDLIRSATRMPGVRLTQGAGYTVTGAPVVVNDLAASLTDSIGLLFVGALLVMAAALLLVFRTRRLRLLPLALALGAAGVTFGAMSLAGASLTMASIAVLPVLIGLGVDYAIQLQARYDEELRRPGATPLEAAERTAILGAPTIASAAGATAVGFLVLLLSPVPMVRSFGVLLVAGIAIAFALALSAGFAALVLVDRRGGVVAPGVLRRAGAGIGAAWRGAGDLLRIERLGRLASRPLGLVRGAGRGALRQAVAHPARVLVVGLVLACAGWGADTQTKVESDITKLVPADLHAVRDITDLQRSTGVAGEIDLMIEADDLTDPRVVRWMRDYQGELLKRYGYTEARGCGRAELCPALSLPDLFTTTASLSSRARIRKLLDSVPQYFSKAVIAPDRRAATLAFGIKLMPLAEQKRVIDDMRRRLHPPAGVHASLVGLPVLAAEANAKLASSWRRFGTLAAGLLAVFLVLLLVFRRLDRALVPLVPIALATGWSALVLYLVRIPLNPMSATLGALVIAISTEFAVILSARYREERSAGLAPPEALARTYRSTGAAVLASGLTAIAGFAVLMLSDIRMLRDFGFVTVVDLSVSLLGVLVVLPAALILAERGKLLSRARQRVRRALPRVRRTRTA